MRTLSEAVLSQPPPPCEECSHSTRCATFLLACKAFEKYVMCGRTGGAERIPSADIFDRIYE